MKKLYVAYGIKFARLTGGVDLDTQKPGDEGLRVYITPVDETGQTVQAAGSGARTPSVSAASPAPAASLQPRGFAA